MRQIERWTNYGIVGALVTGSFKAFPIIIAEKTALNLMRGYYGRLFTNPDYQRHYSNLLKSIRKANLRGILLSGKKVNDDIEKTKKDMED